MSGRRVGWGASEGIPGICGGPHSYAKLAVIFLVFEEDAKQKRKEKPKRKGWKKPTAADPEVGLQSWIQEPLHLRAVVPSTHTPGPGT